MHNRAETHVAPIYTHFIHDVWFCIYNLQFVTVVRVYSVGPKPHNTKPPSILLSWKIHRSQMNRIEFSFWSDQLCACILSQLAYFGWSSWNRWFVILSVLFETNLDWKYFIARKKDIFFNNMRKKNYPNENCGYNG